MREFTNEVHPTVHYLHEKFPFSNNSAQDCIEIVDELFWNTLLKKSSGTFEESLL